MSIVAPEVVEADSCLDNGVIEETERIGCAAPHILQGLVALPEGPRVELLRGLVEILRSLTGRLW